VPAALRPAALLVAEIERGLPHTDRGIRAHTGDRP
jgi:hypothetical protein